MNDYEERTTPLGSGLQGKKLPAGHDGSTNVRKAYDSFFNEVLIPTERRERLEREKEWDFQYDAHCDLLGLVEEFTGTEVDHELWRQGQAHGRRLQEQTEKIARMLEVGGVDPYTERQGLKMLGLCTGLVRSLPNYKDLNFLPVVARRKRKKMLEEITAYLQMEKQGSIIRMWTLTGGARFPLYQGDFGKEDFRRRWRDFHKRINRLNDYLKATWGIEFLYRGTELAGETHGFLRDERGRPTFHLHAHLCVRLHRRLSSVQWEKMLKDVHDQWGSVWKECGQLENPRELVKYVCKPSDLISLAPHELVQMYEVTKGLVFARPLGGIRTWRQHLRKNRLRVTQLGGNWRTCADWNSSRKPRAACEEEPRPLRPTVVALTQPAPVFAPMREPCAIVMNWDGEKPIEFTEFQTELAETALSVHTTSIVAKRGSAETENLQKANAPPFQNPF